MCHCDDLCLHFGDCCWNASPNSSTTQNSPKMECVEFGKGSMVWTVRNCPSDYGDAEVKAKCHTNVLSDDPVLTVPVLDTTTKITYQNRFCSECHNVSTIVPYNISVTGFGQGCQPPNTSVPMDLLRYYLSENPSCSIEFKTNDQINQRKCFPDLLSTCSANDSQLQQDCESRELSPTFVYDPLTGLDIGFKNHFCHACNELYQSTYSYCFPQLTRISEDQTRVLLDTSRLFGYAKVHSLCSDGQIYDNVYVRYILHYCFSNKIYRINIC